MCMVVGKGVGGGQSMMTAAVVVNGMVQGREGNPPLRARIFYDRDE